LVSTRLTEHPEATWVTQQLRESFPFDTTPRYAILDRDGKHGYAAYGTPEPGLGAGADGAAVSVAKSVH
jgi:hypothetical protein